MAGRTWLRIVFIVPGEELQVLDIVLWLNYVYFVFFDSFPFFLHVVTSLIKLLFGSGERLR